MSEHDICDGVIADKNECIAELEEDVARKDATIERLRVAMVKLSCLGNGDNPGNSIGNKIALRALKEETDD